MEKNEFWKSKTLSELTKSEWEALCDRCGICCLYKIKDKGKKIVYTYVACRYLDIRSCKCTEYENRAKVNRICITMEPDSIKKYRFLPDTCAYRRLSEGRDLPPWHPLVTGDPLSTQKAEKSVSTFAISELEAGNLEDHIVHEF